jgi:DNA-binding helix-hairpin-helix protein with protein kinase domain
MLYKLQSVRRGPLVAKVYHNPVTSEKVGKLEAMCRIATPELTRVAAWPTTLLRDSPTGRVVGFLQPRATGREIHELYGYQSRDRLFPKADWRFLIHAAMNCAAAVETVHAHGHVIGDVNSKNVWVRETATISLVDCDSFQVVDGNRRYLCEVGTDFYTPPELQGKPFRETERTRNHDCFGLAVLVFQVLFMARHPYSGVYLGTGEMPIERAISEHRFVFGRNAAAAQMQPPPFSPELSCVSPEVRTLFERAFDKQAAIASRPQASEWRQCLVVPA